MRLKPGVRLHGLVPQMAIANHVVAGVFAEFRLPCVITSANDGKHGDNSLHSRDGLCRALDYRTKYTELDGREQALRDEIKLRLGDDFDVILEDVGGEQEHVHVEWDAK